MAHRSQRKFQDYPEVYSHLCQRLHNGVGASNVLRNHDSVLCYFFEFISIGPLNDFIKNGRNTR